MLFEWDSRKNNSNIIKHGVDFEDAKNIFNGLILESEDTRYDYGEVRMGVLGETNGVVLFIVYTLRKQKIRLISARAANSKEKDLYYVKIQNELGKTEKTE